MMKLLRSLLTTSFSLFFISTQAAIVYTDVSPDKITVASGAGGSLDVDMNNDTIADFRFTNLFSSGLGFVIVQASQIGTSNYVLIDTVGGTKQPYALVNGAPIDSNNSVWHSMASSNPNMLTTFNGTTTGFWINNTQYNLGVKFKIGSNYHYGWIRMSINPNNCDLTLYSYAYESIPDKSISAGNGGLASVHSLEGNLNDVKLFVDIELQLKVQSNDRVEEIVLFDIAGKLVKHKKFNSTLNPVMSVATLPKGIYIAQLVMTDDINKVVRFYIN